MSTQAKAANTSTQQVLTAIISNGVIFAAFVAAFLVLRTRIQRIYQPKSSYDFLPEEKRPEPLPTGLFSWIMPLLKKSDNFIIKQAGLDGYFFIRYLFIMFAFCSCAIVFMYPILLPINAANGYKSSTLDMLSYSNVKHHWRYLAHVFCGWIFYWGLMFVIYRELVYYTSLRQAVLSSPRYGKKLSSRTVLFQHVPQQYLSENEFAKLFTGVKRIWIARGGAEIAKKVEERDNMAIQLENVETSLIKQATKKKLKDQTQSDDVFDFVKRPQHRLKFLIGKKVDTIDYIKETLPKLNEEVQELQANHMSAAAMNSIFVEFESQYEAQLAYQSVVHHTPLMLTPHYIGIDPENVIWSNMRMFWWERLVRKWGAYAAIIALVILWAFPVAFVGMISNITYLTNKLHWLKFIYKLPKPLLGLLTSLAPTVALAVLMMLLPIFIRKMAWFAGAPSTQHVEYFTQQAYFAFQVIQVFLVTTLASSATSTVTEIVEKPTSAMSLLASNLPKSSNFFISYTILQGFSISSGALLQLVPLILYYILGYLFDNTLRKKYARFTGLSSMAWGTTFPVYTNLMVITLAYAVISPLILLFAAVGFFLLYLAYLHNLTYTFGEGTDSRGIHYPRALFQLFVGIYLGNVCLLGLFVVSKNWAAIVLQVISLVITVFVHTNMNAAFDHLVTVVPVDTMKPLDGKSDTVSFISKGAVVKDDGIKHLPQFPLRKYQPRNSQQGHEFTESVLSDNTFELVSESIANDNNMVTVPLLADGDTSPVPPAPFWKRFLQPHIYASYKVAKTRLPDIYQLPDPTESTDDNDNLHAYDFPAVSKRQPELWIPRDQYGFSARIIADMDGIAEIFDGNSIVDEKAKLNFTGPPPYEKKDVADPFEKESR